MAHEATHVVQQQAVAVYRDLEVSDLLPDFDHRRRHVRRPGDPRLHPADRHHRQGPAHRRARHREPHRVRREAPHLRAVRRRRRTAPADHRRPRRHRHAAHGRARGPQPHAVPDRARHLRRVGRDGDHRGDRRQRRDRRALRGRDRRRHPRVRLRRHRRRHRQGPRGRRRRRRAAAAAPRDRAVLEPGQEGVPPRPAARRGRQRTDGRDPRGLPAARGPRRGPRADDRARHAPGDRGLARPAVGRVHGPAQPDGCPVRRRVGRDQPGEPAATSSRTSRRWPTARSRCCRTSARSPPRSCSRSWSWSRSRCWAGPASTRTRSPASTCSP